MFKTSLLRRCSLALLCGTALTWPAATTHSADTAIPRLMQEPGVAWRAYNFGARTRPPGPAEVPYDRTANEWVAPESGIGPITADPAHPFYNNAVAADLGVSSTYRVADLNNEAAKNVMPWAVEALKQQNALVLANKNGETRQARCWETGVPDIHEAPWELYFIQTPTEVVMILGGPGQQIRRVYLNVPHSKNPKPSWYGESVGHYEGDTLVIDTIGFNGKAFVDRYGTPYSEQLHMIERYRVSPDGKAMQAEVTYDDPKAYTTQWKALIRYRLGRDLPVEVACAESPVDPVSGKVYEIPIAEKPDF